MIPRGEQYGVSAKSHLFLSCSRSAPFAALVLRHDPKHTCYIYAVESRSTAVLPFLIDSCITPSFFRAPVLSSLHA